MRVYIFPALFVLSIFSQQSMAQAVLVQPQETAQKSPEQLEKIRYEIDFSKIKQLPKGWKIPGNNAGSIYIKDGFLWVDGRKQSFEPTSILLPSELANLSHYRLDVEFSLQDVNNPSRWGALIYDIALGQGVIPQAYTQFTLRQNARAQNGTELGGKLANGQWHVRAKTAFSEDIQANKIYKATLWVSGQQVKHYLNDVLLQHAEIKRKDLGEIGFSAAGLQMKIKSVKLTTPQIATTTPIQNVATAPNHQGFAATTIIPKVTTHAEQQKIQTGQLYLKLNQQLNLLNASGQVQASFAQYWLDPQRKSLAILEVSDVATLNALKQWSASRDISDLMIVSSSSDLLKTAHDLLPTVRTVLDFSQNKKLGHAFSDLNQIVQQSNQVHAKVVILPEHLAVKKSVQYIQQRLMNVWVMSSAKNEVEAASVMISGANGVISSNYLLLNQVLKKLPAQTLLHQPLIIGHRGVPSLEDENTLESAVRAVNLGADLVENDIYLSKDHQIIVMHDATVDRTTYATGKIEDMTLAQIQQLRTKTKNRHVPTLAEYFKAFKNNKNVVLMIEIKSNNPLIIPALKQEIARYKVADQVVITSFNREQLQRAHREIADVSIGVLAGAFASQQSTADHVKTVLNSVQNYTASYHPAYQKELLAVVQDTQQRGVTYWPWNLNDAAFKQFYIAGLNGVTTNFIQQYSHYIVDIRAPQTVKVARGQTLSLDVQLQQQDKKIVNAKVQNFVVLAGSPTHHLENTSLKFTQKGVDYVLASYKVQLDAQNFYHLVSRPIKVVVE
ncbi:glycerophosphodiester phosphodiesterase [Acinetobacter piscicola]|uniref:glycerophosphodiester phosphodiesterase n=1 Tax=Acinetobacter piscicola TaxID=2006115 RepID=UPI003558A0C8